MQPDPAVQRTYTGGCRVAAASFAVLTHLTTQCMDGGAHLLVYQLSGAPVCAAYLRLYITLEESESSEGRMDTCEPDDLSRRSIPLLLLLARRDSYARSCACDQWRSEVWVGIEN